MKKIIIVVAAFFVMLMAGTAFAGANSNTGCGLGSILWSEMHKSGTDAPILTQVCEATTNGTFGSQTFGITTGTSNCTKPSQFVKNEKLNEFVLKNMDGLAMDIASGKGEYLNTVAELMNVPAKDRLAFGQNLQNNFGSIYTSEKVEMAQVVDQIAALAQ